MESILCMFISATLYQITTSVSPTPPPTSCPSVFYYERQYFNAAALVYPSNHNRLWKGVVLVPPSIPVFLKVQISVPGTLPSSFVGRLELATDKQTVLEKLDSGNLDHIKYYVSFPARVPLPQILSVKVNSRTLCSAFPVPKRVQTKITLQHALYYPSAARSVRGRSPGFDEVPASGVSAHTCGTTSIKNPLIVAGSYATKGTWPWIVPIFKRTTLGVEFLCSGTLVSTRHIITAAHCIKYQTEDGLAASDLIAYVGRHDIRNWTEEGIQPREVEEVMFHPDYDHHSLSSDLAVLRLARHVVLTDHVKLVCLWAGDSNLDLIVGHEAVALGWGMDEKGNKITRVPRTAVMPIVSQETCLRSNKDFVFFTSNRTLCAGLRNGTGPCNGDSGGGLFVSRRMKNNAPQWYLRGVISLSLSPRRGSSQMHPCNLHDFTVFTDVAKYQEWLRFIEVS